MEIPMNNYNDSRKVNELINELLVGFNYGTHKFAACDCYGVGIETCKKVLQAFKDKGYFCYYHQRFDGAWLELQIYTYEYNPYNGGLNRLIRY